MVSLMPSAGVNPLLSDLFRFQKVISGDSKQSYLCECGHPVEGNPAFNLQQHGHPQQLIAYTGHQPAAQQGNNSHHPGDMHSKQVLFYHPTEPLVYPPNANDLRIACPGCGCQQHRPAAPTPISMTGACDACRQAGGANPCCPQQPSRPLQPVGGGWGYCPPIHLDHKALIRPRDKSLPDSTRPTGAPYFAQEKKPSCPPFKVPEPMKSSFTYKDWLKTVDDREPKDCLRNCCIPSLCNWCAPAYYDCCPDINDANSYLIRRQSLSPFY